MSNSVNPLKKHKEFLLYAFFGILTTLVNIVSYYLLYNMLFIKNVPAVIISWALSVAFAFFTNKLFVFESRSFKLNIVLRESATFFSARLFTGVLDVIIMYIAVDLLLLDSLFWKIVSNVIVVILNYILSKIWIFKKQ
ncbi:MAG: GtrA family protein [Clostridia bacterium]|nr:GtrA family protein [Clostridia bacterium]